MTEGHEDGYWEEIGFIWLNDWPYEDTNEAYETLNMVLPENVMAMPIYKPSGEDEVKLLEWIKE